MMMNTTDRTDEIIEVEAHREEDINHRQRMNIHQETIEIIGKEKTEINIGINQMKIRTTIVAVILRITIIVSEKILKLPVEIRLMREEKIILNLKLRSKPKKSMKVSFLRI